MPLTKEQIKSTYPLPAYNYKVTIYSSEYIFGSKDALTMGFSEVSGLTAQFGHAVYRHGLSFLTGLSVIRGQMEPLQIKLKRGVVYNGNKDFLYSWLGSEDRVLLQKSLSKDITIDLCDESGKALIQWLIKDAVPVKLDMPEFSATDNDAAVESLDVIGHSLKVNYSL